MISKILSIVIPYAILSFCSHDYSMAVSFFQGLITSRKVLPNIMSPECIPLSQYCPSFISLDEWVSKMHQIHLGDWLKHTAGPHLLASF